MSTEKGAAKTSLSSEGKSAGTDTANLEQQQQQIQPQTTQPKDETVEASEETSKQSTERGEEKEEKAGKAASSGAGVEGSYETIASGTQTRDSPRQVIAVSASKSPAAFFNLARKFLVTNEMCDLSALEGAIVSAVDAAHLLERSQLATIVGIHTSYVSVEPKRRKQSSHQGEQDMALVQPSQPSGLAAGGEVAATPGASETEAQTSLEAPNFGEETEASPSTSRSTTTTPQTTRQGGSRGSSGGRELRRARIVVTVRRTESYKRWLEENPLQAMIASEADDDTEPMGAPSGSKDPKQN